MLSLEKKLEQKSKELEEINSATKKLIQNKDNIILKYESELELKNREKMLLISQNKELLNKLNEGEENKTDKEEKNNNENYLLKEEIKTLKEQLENQAHDLLTLNSLENQINILKVENDNLKMKNQNIIKDNKENDELLTNSVKINHSLSSNINNSSNKKVKKRLSITIVKDKQKNNNDKMNLDKKEEIIKLKENEIIKEKEDVNINEIEKLNDEITKLKVKYLNMEFENESKIVKYKNILKNIEAQCKKVGVKIDFNFDK